MQNKTEPGSTEPAGVRLAEPEPGDLSWLQHRHMQVMAPAYGWDARYEAHVARIVADLLERRDPARERFWVARRGSSLLGCVGLTRVDDRRARLRLLFVEPEARGQGLGGRLVEACVSFARQAGYGEIVLWTVDVLEAARTLYARAGFRMVAAEPSELSGAMRDETWLLKL